MIIRVDKAGMEALEYMAKLSMVACGPQVISTINKTMNAVRMIKDPAKNKKKQRGEKHGNAKTSERTVSDN
jgi:hypothetical protein